MTHYNDRPHTIDTNFAYTASKVLVLATENEVDTALVYVQHKNFSIMCVVDAIDGKIYPLACKIGSSSSALHDYNMLNYKGAYKRGLIVYNDGDYKLHTMISNQLATRY